MAIKLPDNIKVAWQPFHGTCDENGKYIMSSQELALTCPADIILLSSSRASGKTEVSLIMFAKNVGLGYGKYYRGVYIDCHYPDLQDVIARSQRLFPLIFGNRAKFHGANGNQRWCFDTGEELLFRVGYKKEDYNSFHGQELPFLLYNEITKQPTSEFFDLMKTTNRTSFNPKDHPYFIDGKILKSTGIEVRCRETDPNAEIRYLPPLRPRIVITTNPSGAGKQWVKERFVDPAPAGKILKIEKEIYNPQTKKKEIMVKTQVHIFSSYKENYHLSPENILELESIEDPELRKAWLYGDWECSDGQGMFNDLFRKNIHVVKPFEIPRSWYIERSFDWGWSKPFAVIWSATSDGTDIVYPNGEKIHTVAGDVFVFKEYYGCVKGKPNTGLQMLAVDVAKNIVEIEIATDLYGRVHDGVADSAINKAEDGHSIADEMRKSVKIGAQWYRGVTWLDADKRAGSRSMGWELIRKRLRNAIPTKDSNNLILPRENKAIYFTDDCVNTLRTLPNMQRDPRKEFDINTDAEDHICDAIRYMILSKDMKLGGNMTMGMY